MRERDVEKYLVRIVKAMGGECRKVKWINRNGAPDRFVMFPNGYAAWIELKRPGGRLESHQAREHKRMRAMGQTVLVLDSIDKIDRWAETC